MNLAERLASTSWEMAIACAVPILAVPWPSLVVAGFLGAALLLIGRRLSWFAKPDRPYLSPAVRSIGVAIKVAGYLAAATSAGWAFLVFTFLLLHETFVRSTLLDALLSTWTTLWEVGQAHMLGLLSGCLAGVFTSLPIIWRVIPQWERGRGLPDVRELVRRFKRFDTYDPIPYVDVGRGCYIGRDAKEQPIYVSWRKLHETHVQVLGMTGSGKGVVMSLIAYQCALAGECVIWFDPKYDRYSPRILQAAATQAGRPFYLVNLNKSSGPQLNPFLGASEFEIEELLVAAFDLRSKGTDGDFYRGKDEDAASEAARLAVESGCASIPGMFRACTSVSSITEQENFWRKLKKLARLSAVHTEEGLCLSKAMADQAVIYVIGSADSEPVKMLQKLLLVRIMQIIKGRERLVEHAPTCIVLDEFKHMLSPAAFTSLGVVRDFDTHILLAHQSLGDLNACPGIDPAEALGAVVDNTAIKIVYKIGDDTYAERLARVSGKRRTYVDTSAKWSDEQGAGGSWREDEVHHVDMDLMTHLPMPSDRPGQASVGVLFGVGNAQLFHVGAIAIDGDMPDPVEAMPYAACCDSEAELI